MKNCMYFVGIYLLLSTLSCKKFLDVNLLDTLAPDNYYTTEKHLDYALTGVYNVLGQVYRTQRLHHFALAGDEGYTSNASALIGVHLFNAASNDGHVLTQWTDLYRGINRANTLLKNLYKNPELDKEKVSQIKGETLFLRAYYYFLLVQSWGDVPLILEPATSPAQVSSVRTPMDKVYEQILVDMETAEPLVASIKSLGFGGRVSKSAVRGMLARVNLHMAGHPLNNKARFEEVRKWTKTVIDDSEAQHSLNPSFSQIFINYAQDLYDIKESIFEIEYWGNDQSIYNQTGYVGSSLGAASTNPNTGLAQGNTRATKTFLDSFKPGDLRRYWSIAHFKYNSKGEKGAKTFVTSTAHKDLWALSAGKYRREYEANPVGRGTPQNFPLLRYSDILLMYAEAENELDNPLPAIDAVNKVRERAWSSGIKSIEITNSGTGYKSIPQVIIKGGGGENAYAAATIDKNTGQVTSVQFELDAITGVKNGNSYSSLPTIEFVGGGGTGASAVASIYSLTDAHLTSKETASKETLRDAILTERSLELCFELLRRFDLNRHQLFVEKMHDVATQIEIDVPGAEYIRKFKNVSTRDYLLPIPENELTLNPAMTQNPGF